jgi:hypothetical protein
MEKENYDLITKHVASTLEHTYGQNIIKVRKNIYVVTTEYYRNKSYTEKSNDDILTENTINSFMYDLKQFLVNDIPFQLIFHDRCYTSRYSSVNRFFELLMSNIYYSGKNNIQINLKNFKKLIHLFKDIMQAASTSSLFPTFCDSAIQNNPYHLEFSKEILSFDNKIDYSHDDGKKFWEHVEYEIKKISKSYHGQKSNLLKEGFINYLKNREYFLDKHKDRYKETSLLKTIKSILHSDHWAEVSSYLPNYANRRNEIENKEIFNIDTNPVYCINIDQTNLLNLSSATITDYDLFNMMKDICEALNITKPQNMHTIELSHVENGWNQGHTKWNDPRIYLSGKNLNNNLVNDILKIIKNMIIEYNSDNVDKNLDDFTIRDEKDKKNFDYLVKMAEVYWLDLELDDAKGINKKVNKI